MGGGQLFAILFGRPLWTALTRKKYVLCPQYLGALALPENDA